jgi:FkbM family methyltransferase
MSYLEFVNHINKNKINIIFELGSRDLIDSIKLVDYFDNSSIYAFECNPDCLNECNKRLNELDEEYKKKINLIDKAVSIVDGYINFYPIDLSKYNNMGSSSLLKIDFSSRDKNDPDYNLKNIQKEILIEGIRLDTFINKNNINNIDLLCIDLQGYELNALKSLGDNFLV